MGLLVGRSFVRSFVVNMRLCILFRKLDTVRLLYVYKMTSSGTFAFISTFSDCRSLIMFSLYHFSGN